jgi:hypothetical protein
MGKRWKHTVVNITAGLTNLSVELLISVNPPHGDVSADAVLGLNVFADRQQLLYQLFFYFTGSHAQTRAAVLSLADRFE